MIILFSKKNPILNATTVQLSLYLDQLKEENYKLLDKLVKAICKLFCFIRDTTSVNLFVCFQDQMSPQDIQD